MMDQLINYPRGFALSKRYPDDPNSATCIPTTDCDSEEKVRQYAETRFGKPWAEIEADGWYVSILEPFSCMVVG